MLSAKLVSCGCPHVVARLSASVMPSVKAGEGPPEGGSTRRLRCSCGSERAVLPEAPSPGRGSERLPRRGSCCQTPRPSSSPGSPHSRDSGSAVGAARGDLSLRVPARSHSHSHPTRGRTLTHTQLHTLPPRAWERTWTQTGLPAGGAGAFTAGSRCLRLGCVLLCSGGSVGYCVRRTALCQLSPQRGSHRACPSAAS